MIVEHGIVWAANPSLLGLLDTTRSALLGRPLRTLLHGASVSDCLALERPRAGPPRTSCRCVARIRDGDGRWVPVELHTVASGRGRELLLLLDQTLHQRRCAGLLHDRATLQARIASQVDDEGRHARQVANLVHDDVLQALAAVQMDVETVCATIDVAHPEESAVLGRVVQHLGQTLRATRRVIDELNPPVLAEFGLAAALDSLAVQAEVSRNLRIERDWGDGTRAAAGVDRPRALVLYRVAEAWLDEIAQQARDSQVRIALRTFQATGALLEVEVDAAIVETSSSRLRRLVERLHAFDGELHVVTTPRGGTRLSARVPPAGGTHGDLAADTERQALLGLFYRLPIGIVETDEQGRIELINPAAARLLLPLAQGRPLDNLFDALGAALPTLRRTLEVAAPATGPGRLIVRDTVACRGVPSATLSVYRQAGTRLLTLVAEAGS